MNKNNLVIQNWAFGLLALLLVVIEISRIELYRFGFCTLYDDAYFLLKASKAYEGIVDGGSQWNLIATKLFPYWDLSNMIFAKKASIVLAFVTAINATVACFISFGKKYTLPALAISLLIILPIFGQISYVVLQAFLLCTSVSAFLIYKNTSNRRVGLTMLLISGLTAGFSLFVILPGAALIIFAYALYLCITGFEDKKKMAIELSVGLIGVILSVVFMHLFVCDIREILNAMQFTAGYITQNGHGYSTMQFAVSIGLFIRDALITVVFYIGAYYLSNKICPSRFKWIGTLIYLFLILCLFYYQKSPKTSTSVIFSSILIIPFLWGTGKSKNGVENILFFIYPLLASIGTNTYLGTRMLFFLIPWIFVWVGAISKGNKTVNWSVVLPAIIIILFPFLGDTIQAFNTRDDSHHFDRGNPNFAQIAINDAQEKYYNNVFDIVSRYGFKTGQSIMFATNFDYATLYALDAVIAADVYQPENFKFYKDRKDTKIPDFIILCNWDEIVLGKELSEMPWGWPEDFDVFEIGTPETEIITSEELEKRKLYCRKSCRNNT